MNELLNNPRTLIAFALLLLTLALLVITGSLFKWTYGQWRRKKQLNQTIQARHSAVSSLAQPSTNEKNEKPNHLDDLTQTAISLGSKWEKGRLGDALLADEDKQLVDLAGYEDRALARSLFTFSRAVLSLGLPIISLLFIQDINFLNNRMLSALIIVFLGFGLGWLMPKWYLNSRVKTRKRAVLQELPLFIDILRLLQGVGLSIDQSLHTINQQFKKITPILVFEFSIAQDLYARGRTREQSFNRLIHHFNNDELTALCRLIQQIDQYGGAVQEPLNRFSARLQEQRKLELKEKVGKLTVKMTGVMIITLMPALVIVTGGSGFLAVFRGLARVGGGL